MRLLLIFNVIFSVPLYVSYISETQINIANNYISFFFLLDRWVMTVYNKVIEDIQHYFSIIHDDSYL